MGGILVGEQFHPLFGGDIDVPAAFAFQQTPLEAFWPSVVAAIAIPEIYSVFTFQEPGLKGSTQWTIREDHEPGNLGFDPLGLKPTDPKELKDMQTKELNNGRLAMIAAAGMIRSWPQVKSSFRCEGLVTVSFSVSVAAFVAVFSLLRCSPFRCSPDAALCGFASFVASLFA